MTSSDVAARVIELEAQVARLERERNERGEGAILQALMDDIARRRAIEEELRRANEWLHLAQEAGRVAAYTYDFRTEKLDWSRSTKSLYGFPADRDATLEGLLAAVHPEDRLERRRPQPAEHLPAQLTERPQRPSSVVQGCLLE